MFKVNRGQVSECGARVKKLFRAGGKVRDVAQESQIKISDIRRVFGLSTAEQIRGAPNLEELFSLLAAQEEANNLTPFLRKLANERLEELC